MDLEKQQQSSHSQPIFGKMVKTTAILSVCCFMQKEFSSGAFIGMNPPHTGFAV
ncbi:hypothetical protein [Lacrimispora celerecrescens]|uniref:hypothetical protein n=1 Tax=Lacrimispora celerecrescens TaxID=29354 RepID=UPI001FCABFDC|nr:hypothetical protein [Lacrimispora celerecrescens]